MTIVQAEIENCLKHRIGLNPDAMGPYGVQAAIRRRMAACQIATPEEYWQRLQNSEPEMQALIEQVVVPETWFFRDRNPFLFLGHYVLTEWRSTYPDRPLRILSVPCSTGEEPYSIAMALLDVGLPTTRFHIEAFDISEVALAKAKQGWYGRNSFRSGDLSFRDRHFQPSGDGYQLSERVQAQVTFSLKNLLSPLFGMDKLPYDIVFCRNLLIYLDNIARQKGVAALDRLLLPDGLLFVGHAEMGPLLQNRFTPIRQPLTFAYRKAKPEKSQSHPSVSRLPIQPIERPNTPPGAKLYSPTAQPPSLEIKRQAAVDPSVNPTITLEQIQHLANTGQLQQAATQGQRYLKQHPLDAAAYRLAGVVQQALGNTTLAEQYWQQALYLNPNDEETLTLLLLLKEQKGDMEGTELLKKRLQRLNQP